MATNTSPTNALIGATIDGKYRVTREIGRGGMAAVYEAVNVDIGKRVAVKVLNPEFAHSTIVVERFFREARAAAAVRSPYICDVYDAGRLEDERPYLVLELLEGESLYERMIKAYRFDTAFVAKIFSQVGRGLTKAHESNVIHRDLKPENIFITKGDDGSPLAKIVDFGLAKFYAPFDGDEAQKRLTREGAVFGTPAYMSPEQVQGHGRVDHRADLWAIACIVYECLIGKTVWSTEQGVAMIFAHIATADVPVPSKDRPDLPASFDAWFAKAMQRDPNKRFQTSKELTDALVKALDQGHPSLYLQRGFSDRESGLQPPVITSVDSPQSDPEAFAKTEPPPASDPTNVVPPVEFVTDSSPVSQDLFAGSTPQSPADMPLFVPISEGDPALHPLLAAAIPSSDGQSEALSAPSTPGLEAVDDSKGYPKARRKRRTYHAVLATLAIVSVAALGGYLVWTQVWRAAPLAAAPAASASGSGGVAAGLKDAGTAAVAASEQAISATASAATTTDLLVRSKAADDVPDWVKFMSEGQQLLAQGKTNEAQQLFQRSIGNTTSTVPRVLLENLRLALSSPGVCQIKALGRPRSYERLESVHPPTITATEQGAVIAWADDHELKGQWHGYTQLMDDALLANGIPVNVTPEATAVQALRLASVGNEMVLAYTEPRGSTPALFVRRLTNQGRIAGQPVVVTPLRGAVSADVAAAKPDGFWVVYTTEPEKQAASRVWVRRFDSDGKPQHDAKLIAEYGSKPGRQTAKAFGPSVAQTNDALLVTYRLEQPRWQWNVLQHIAIDDPQFATGLDVKTESVLPRNVGKVTELTEKTRQFQPPSFACDATSCYAAWSEGNKGVHAAYVQPETGTVIWRKRFVQKGSQVTVSTNGSGVGLLAWYNNRRLYVAPIVRDGIGQSTLIARLKGDQSGPSVAPRDDAGHWTIGWSDFEAGHLEPYVASVACK